MIYQLGIYRNTITWNPLAPKITTKRKKITTHATTKVPAWKTSWVHQFGIIARPAILLHVLSSGL